MKTKRKQRIPPPTITMNDRGWVFHEWKLPRGFKLRKTLASWKKGPDQEWGWEVVDPSSERGTSGWHVAPNFFEVLLKLAITPRKPKKRKPCKST